MRLDMNVPVVAAVLFAAAVAQDLIPVTPQVPVKIVFLTAAGLYFAMTKPVPVALTALVWAGGMTDALGGLPLFCTLTFLLLVYGAVRMLQRVFLAPTLGQGTLLLGGVSLLQTLWTRFWTETGGVFFSVDTLRVLGASAWVGLAAGFAGFAVCGLADRISGNVKQTKEGNGILWAETDR